MIVKTALEVSDRVRSTLGPLGMDKMLVDSLGNQLLTNDGATILKNLEMKDPVGKLIIEVAKAQEARYYDGTTSCVILVGELLRSADELIEKGIHPNIITKGYRRALDIATQFIDDESWHADSPRECAELAVKTALTGKSAESHLEHLATITVDAAELAKPHNIKIVKLAGEVSDSRCVDGLAILNRPCLPEMKQKGKGGILVLDEELAPPQANMTLSDPQRIAEVAEAQKAYLQNRLSYLTELGIKAVICQKGIDPRAQEHFSREGIMAVRNVRRSDMERIAKLIHGRVVKDLAGMEEGDLGSGEYDVKETYITISGKGSGAATIMLHTPTEQAADEVERALDDAVGVASLLLDNPVTVPGAGAIQVMTADAIRSTRPHDSGKIQAAVEAYAESLEIIPRTLAESGGMDVMDTLLEMRKEREIISPYMGVDVIKGKVASMPDVVEPSVVTSGAMQAATENVIALLRTDELVMAKKLKGQDAP